MRNYSSQKMVSKMSITDLMICLQGDLKFVPLGLVRTGGVAEIPWQSPARVDEIGHAPNRKE